MLALALEAPTNLTARVTLKQSRRLWQAPGCDSPFEFLPLKPLRKPGNAALSAASTATRSHARCWDTKPAESAERPPLEAHKSSGPPAQHRQKSQTAPRSR